MCTTVSVGFLWCECETIGALSDALGIEPATISTLGREYCLCGVDIAALGGRRTTDAEGYPFPEWIIERMPAQLAQAERRDYRDDDVSIDDLIGGNS
jgi:hypothetical protein